MCNRHWTSNFGLLILEKVLLSLAACGSRLLRMITLIEDLQVVKVPEI